MISINALSSAGAAASAPAAAADKRPHLLRNVGKGDAASLLPPQAAKRFRAWRDKTADILQASRMLWQELTDRRLDMQRLRIHHEHVSDQVGPPADEHPAVIDCKQQLDTCAAEVAEMQSRYDALVEQHRHLAGLTQNNLHRYLTEDSRGVTLQAYSGPEPQLQKGEVPADAAERCARRGRELKSDIQKFIAAPIPSEQAKKIVRAQLAELAARGEPNFASVIDHGEPMAFAKTQGELFLTEKSQLGMAVTVVDTAALLAWALGDRLVDIAEKAIEARSDNAAALTPKARAEALATARSDLLAVEREECFWALANNALPRRDVDPRAALAIVGPPPA